MLPLAFRSKNSDAGSEGSPLPIATSDDGTLLRDVFSHTAVCSSARAPNEAENDKTLSCPIG